MLHICGGVNANNEELMNADYDIVLICYLYFTI